MPPALRDICSFPQGRIPVSSLTKETYISTENMLPGKAGIAPSATLPKTASTPAYAKGDVLVSNIRPYFKKIWQAKGEGGCSPDVLVFRAKENTDARYLYYVLSHDAFFRYATATAKGTKMPRGDKGQLMRYPVPDIGIGEQKRRE